RIYARTPADPGYTQFAWSCTGHPALGTYLATSYFACQGGDRAVWYATFSGGWSGASSLGGVVIDGPGVAVGPAGPRFFAEGGNRAVFSRSLSVGWSQVGGTINFGVAAVALN
ncbi:MAG TPA: hypothetical protein VGR61_07405, partial [Candidatus Dormibacteraeota bacterium]|nr:hypothetical protein [Candidatus Dormibacteraeota bacterium]